MNNKPITLTISEFKEQFTNLMNESGLPAWLLLIIIEPFVSQLRELSRMQEDEDKKMWEESQKEKDKEATEPQNNDEIIE